MYCKFPNSVQLGNLVPLCAGRCFDSCLNLPVGILHYLPYWSRAQLHARHVNFKKIRQSDGHFRFLRMKRHQDQEISSKLPDPFSCLRKREWSEDETKVK